MPHCFSSFCGYQFIQQLYQLLLCGDVAPNAHVRVVEKPDKGAEGVAGGYRMDRLHPA
jgi:hypothetical protein